MKRLLAITAVMLLSSALFFVVVCAAGDMKANSNSSAVAARPFKGSWSGGSNFLVSEICPAGSILAIATAKGIVTITGASEYNGTYCCDPTGHCTGGAVITAANGDALYLSLVHDFNPVSGIWNQSEVITGGTGRFVGATGMSTSSGTSMMTGPTSDIWAGTSAGEILF